MKRRARALVLIVLALGGTPSFSGEEAGAGPPLAVTVEPRVELLSVIFRTRK